MKVTRDVKTESLGNLVLSTPPIGDTKGAAGQGESLVLGVCFV